MHRAAAALRALACICVISIVLCVGCAVAAKQKGVSLSLRARWQGTSFAMEAAEFLADEDQQLFWKYITSLDLGSKSSSSSSAECWQAITSQAAAHLTSNVAKILPVVLGVRQYSARLEAFRQLAKQLHHNITATIGSSCCFVDVNGVTTASSAELQQLVQQQLRQANRGNSSVQLFDVDHVYGSGRSAAAGAVHAVLYGPLGSKCWSEMHTILAATAEESPADFVYAARPVLFEGCQVSRCGQLGAEQQLVLPGYGVEAVLKNMEYSAVDDKAKAAAAAQRQGQAGSDEPLGVAKGIDFDQLVKRKPHLKQELLTVRDVLNAADDAEAIKVWELKDAGLQAATRILAAADPLALLREISQEFPGIISSLTRQKVAGALRKEVKSNQQALGAGGGYLMLNGLLLEINNFELYSFLDRLRTELRLQDQLRGLGLPPAVVNPLLTKRSEDKSDTLQDLRLDLSPISKVLWVNNLEKDAAYKMYSSNLHSLFSMNFGRMPTLARNIFSVVAICDPLSAGGLAAADFTNTVEESVGPLRIGLLPVVAEVTERLLQEQLQPGVPVALPSWKEMSRTEQFMRGFLTLKAAFGPKQAFRYWSLIQDPGVTSEQLLQLFETAWKLAAKSDKSTWTSPKKAGRAAQKKPSEARGDLEAGRGYSSEVGMQLQELGRYMLRKGLAHLPRGQVWFNGVMMPMPEGGVVALEREVWGALMYTHMRELQENLWNGYINNDEEDVLGALLELTKSVRRWNPRLLASGDEPGAAGKLSLVKTAGHPGFQHIPYLHAPKSSSKVKAVSHLLAVDLAQPRGRALLVSGLEWALEDEGGEAAAGRLGLVLAPAGEVSMLDALVLLLAEGFTNDTAVLKGVKALLTKSASLATTPAAAVTQSALDAALEVVTEAGLSLGGLKLGPQQLAEAAKKVEQLADLGREVLNVPSGGAAVVSNGRMLVDFTPGGVPSPPLVAEDFQLMQLYGSDFQPGLALATSLRAANSSGTVKMSARELSDVVMVAASTFAVQEYPDARYGAMDQAKQLSSAIAAMKGPKVSVNSSSGSNAALQLVAVLDPLSRVGQRTSQVLAWVAQLLDPAVTLFLNPVMDLTDMPLKEFYRYALPEFERDAAGNLLMPATPTAYFPRLPAKRVLTINLETPESWLVEPVMALHDLDNLLLEALPEQVAFAEYELEAVVLTGSCSEVLANGRPASPPRGLQLHLGTAQQPHQVDTLVMSNLGYFQLKASPGLWQLSIAPGRSRTLYRLLSSTGTRSGPQWSWWGGEGGSSGGSSAGVVTDNSTQVLMTSFSGKHMNLRVMKRPGKENLSLLMDSNTTAAAKAGKSSPSPSSSSAWGDEEDAVVVSGSGKNASDVINVFTVASGHMYERLQKIMILSVINNTKSRVKFWIIKNYMSPHHKRIIPQMAAHYGFDYEFVTYKWPHWLRKQTDKQRIIWAYKILFLDVLFPLDVPRMIFVDSDQVVRTDLAELYHMDLKGAPLAYTPFCDNNKEMDPFRFWKGGFWLSHLGDKPYHISALYLIDLKRFRQQAAGDQYRITYDNLSRDPNSLANLDQDLPNYMQHQIPIFSLPQEWLWCESWCGNQTKAKAKTIDLCNNPKTKEPKLTAARRIIAEWPALDAEQGNFTAKIDAMFLQQEAAFLEGGAAAGDAGLVAEGAAAAAAAVAAAEQAKEQQQQGDGSSSGSGSGSTNAEVSSGAVEEQQGSTGGQAVHDEL